MENISVCIRIRPKQKDEESTWRLDGNTILNGKSKEIFTFDNIIETNSSNHDMFNKIAKNNLLNFSNGINISIFTYGQTSTGKTYTMRGTDKNPGIIPIAIREIFKLLDDDKTISKYILKASYMELYNETVNDLLNSNNKNLEIRESVTKGVFVNNLTEIQVTNPEKAMQLLKQGDSVRVIAETKLNEKSSRSHSIFRLNLEVTKIFESKNKTFFSQMNLIDLAGSENVSKAKTDGIRMKEGSNINKSLLALSNVISKLSANPKSFVNYRDSKLTRLLQNGLSGNSKTTIICTISDTQNCYSETLNTLHFGNKAKNIKTDIKINEMLDEKNKIISENTQLKNKIKALEDMMLEKKELEIKKKILSGSGKGKIQNSEKDNIGKCEEVKNSGSFEKIFSESCASLLEEDKTKDKMINALESEINILKRMLITNEEIGEENMEINNIHDNYSLNSFPNNNNNPNTINHTSNAHLNLSATKYPKMSMIMSSGAKMSESASKIYNNNRDNFYEPESMNYYNNRDYQTSNSIYRRNLTEKKINNLNNSSMKNSFTNNHLNNSSKKPNNILNYQNNYNNLLSSSMKNSQFNNMNPNNLLNINNQLNQFNTDAEIEMFLNERNFNQYNNHLTTDGYIPSGYRNNHNQIGSFNPHNNSLNDFQNFTNFGMNNNCNNDIQIFQLVKENEEIKNNYLDLKNKFFETIQIKDNQIKSATANLNMAMDNCEKLIKEAEENYMNLKLSNERIVKELELKENELKNFNQNLKNSEFNILNYKEEINKLNQEISYLKNNNTLKDMENEVTNLKNKCDNYFNENENLKKIQKDFFSINEKLKIENNHLKISTENNKSENLSYKTQVECLKKTNESLNNDIGKQKNDIESYKNELNTNKDKITKLKSELFSFKSNFEKLQNQINNNTEKNIKSTTSGNNNTSAASKIVTDKDKKFLGNNNLNTENLEKFKQKISELENEIKAKNSHLNLLENENTNIKIKLSAYDQNNILEYEKVLDESLNKIKDYDMKLNLANDKINFYEKMLKISKVEKNNSIETPNRSFTGEKIITNNTNVNILRISQSNIKNQTQNSMNSNCKPFDNYNNGVSQFNYNEIENNFKNNIIQTPKKTNSKNYNIGSKLNSNNFCSPAKFQVCESNEFLGKKRHLSKVYQNMIDNNLKTAAGDGNNTTNVMISEVKGSNLKINLKEEKENFKEACFSSFEI